MFCQSLKRYRSHTRKCIKPRTFFQNCKGVHRLPSCPVKEHCRTLELLLGVVHLRQCLETQKDGQSNSKKKPSEQPRNKYARVRWAPLLHPALLNMAVHIYILSFLLVKQKSTICPTTFRFQETEMRADVVFHCLFSFLSSSFYAWLYFCYDTLKRKYIYLELFFPPNYSKAWVFFSEKCLSHRRSGEYSHGYLPREVLSCPVDVPSWPSMVGAMPYSSPIPTWSFCSNYRLRF